MTHHMWNEINTQHHAWQEAFAAIRSQQSELAAIITRHREREIRFIGAGSSYCAALAASLYWGRQGFQARVVPPSEQLFQAAAYPFEVPPLVIALSRSGSTTEVNEAVRALSQQGCECIAITTSSGTPIENLVNVTICAPSARERGIVQTRSFNTLLVAAQALCTLYADTPLVAFQESLALADGWLKASQNATEHISERIKRVYILGTGEAWGVALEGALLLKETALVEAEGFQTFEFRHGPQSMIDQDTLLIFLMDSANLAMHTTIVKEMAQLGAEIMVIGKGVKQLDVDCLSLELDTSLPDPVLAALYLMPIQLFAYKCSVAKGLDPDAPRHLQFAIQFSELHSSV